jgi:hypothetical protein
MRLVLPGAGALVGLVVGSFASGVDPGGATGAGVGFLVGAGTAMLIDAFVFAREPSAPAPGAVRIAPAIRISRDRAAATVAGAV